MVSQTAKHNCAVQIAEFETLFQSVGRLRKEVNNSSYFFHSMYFLTAALAPCPVLEHH